MDKTLLKLNNSIIRITGIFELEHHTKAQQHFSKNGYTREIVEDPQSQKNYWYPEFRDIFFSQENKEVAAAIFKKAINKEVCFLKKNYPTQETIQIKTIVDYAEIFLFPNGLHFFSISFDTSGLELNQVSEITNMARNFMSNLEGDKTNKWVNWVENEILCGIKIYSNWNETPIPVDEYSGSKFKLYTVIDLAEDPSINQDVIDELLYDIGCVAPLNSARGNTSLTPSESYYKDLLNDKISAFNNYSMLPLFDTFTTAGYNLLTNDWQKTTYQNTYFRIYLFNLFIKYNLYRYNHEMRTDTVKIRNKFESFLNHYNLSVISYNFLPNLIFEKHRKSMMVEEELNKFEERINKISQTIQEEQQSRMNILIGLVGLITSIGTIEPAIEIFENTRTSIGWGISTFYTLTGFVFVLIAIPILAFLFPEKKKQLLRKWKKK